jgi:hypothetical protein
MAFLDWLNKGAQTNGKSAGEHKQAAHLKQPGEPFKRGDRVVVYETFHVGNELKRDPRHAPGIVSSVHHNGTLVSYDRGGRLPANAAVEDVRHATEPDVHKYGKEFAAIEVNMERQPAPSSAPKSGTKTLPRQRPSWER